jgi:translation elongation factor aEF-1 beta
MALALIKVKIMPESPEANLKEIESEAQKLMEKEGAKNISFAEEPIAFGLKAIMLKYFFLF